MQRLSSTDPIWAIILVSTILLTPSMSQEGESSGKRRERQVFREDVSPLLAGGKVPSFAFDWTRLMFNNLDSRGISMPDGMTFSADRLQDGRSDEKRLILFRDDNLVPNIPSTYNLRYPIEFPFYQTNPMNPPDSFIDQHIETTGSFSYCPGNCHYPEYDEEGENGNLRGDYDDGAKKRALYSDDIAQNHLRPEHFPRNEGIRYIKNAEQLKSSHFRPYYKKPHVLFKKFHGHPIQPLEVILKDVNA